MAKEPFAEKLKEDGLRYKAKLNGSPFSAHVPGKTMSCLRCGLHKLRSNGVFASMFGGRQFICFDCRPPKHIDVPDQKS